MAPERTNLAIELGLLGALAWLWGSSYLLTKVAVTTMPPLTLVAARVLIAAIVLSGVMALQGHRLPRDGRTWRMLLVQAMLNSIGAWTLLAWGQQFIDSGLASVLNSTSPIFVFFFTLLVTRHEPVNALKLGGAILGLIGVTLIVGVDVLRGVGQQVLGQLAAIAGAMLYGIAAIYGKRFGHLPAVTTAAGTMIWAGALLVPAALVVDWPLQRTPAMVSILAACGLGVFSTGLALLIYFRLVRTLGSMGVASQSYLRAGLGVVLGIVVLGEEIPLTVGLGLIAAICGVAAINARVPTWRARAKT